MAKDLFSKNDKQILFDTAGTIESGLMRVADAIGETHCNDYELWEAIRFAGERVEHGCLLIANSIDRFARCFEKE